MTQVMREEYDAAERDQQERNEARHIKNNVDKARKDHSVSGERWPFELLQNAHDTGPREGLKRVDVTIEWKNTEERAEFSFKHNGAPFLPQDLAALLSGGSNKDYKSETTTGRFGTGFLVTHVLSPRTEVGGLIKIKEGIERFTVTLNRSGDEESILENIKECKANLNKAFQVDDIDGLPSAEFKYYVDNSASMRQGLDTLREALPYLFATCPLLGAVDLCGVSGDGESWEAEEENRVDRDGFIICERTLRLSRKTGKTTKYRILSVSSAADTSAVIVAARLIADKWRVCVPPDSLPRVFRRFPIQYSSALPICFIINGLFNVGEDRQKVYFESEADRSQMHDALSLIPTAMGFLLEKDWEGAHLLSGLSEPKLSPFISDENMVWWRSELYQVAKRLSEMPLVRTGRGMGPAASSDGWSADFVSPLFSSSVPRAVPYERLWGLINSTDHFIPPDLEISSEWTNIAEGWKGLGVNIPLVTLEGLALEVRKSENGEQIRTLEQLRVLTDKREWLARFFDLVGECLADLDAIDVGLVEGLMPDQHGNMRSPRELRRDAGVPESLKDIAELIDADVRSLLVDKELLTVAQGLGMAHTEAALDKLVPKALTGDEVVERCLKRLDEKLVNGKRLRDEEDGLLKGGVHLLAHVWKIKGESGEATARRCPLVASDNTILRYTESQPIMAPVARWPEKARPFHEAYPEQRILAPIYAGDTNEGIPDVVDGLVRWKIAYGDLLTESSPVLDGDRLKAAVRDKDGVEGMTVSGETFSQIALLARELIPRSGSNFAAAKALLGLTLCYITPQDSKWRQWRPVEGKKAAVKAPISIREALWVADLQYRAWVPAKGDEGNTISVVANSSNLEDLLEPNWLDGNNDAIELLSKCFGYDALKLRLLVAATDENARQKIRDDLANLVEAAGSDLDILTELATDIEARKKQKRDISRWRKLGLAVQDAVQESLEARNLKVKVVDVGGDFEVVIQQGGTIDEASLAKLKIHDYIVEVKATTQGEARMTPTQALNAAGKTERYVLCVVDLRNVSEIDLDRDWTAQRVEPLMRLLPDIGLYMQDPTGFIEAARNCEVGIRNDAALRYGVPAKVWGKGISLNDWLSNL
ncbi:MAG: hypothetical protein AUG51_16060 [Acidobacteria bacterium 13_1_20CM_3_53_8]|nr:MAG: hypothetical protein AUG51_16060 [Acidobacteria bacterium 13_1_20CM_3_53_8]